MVMMTSIRLPDKAPDSEPAPKMLSEGHTQAASLCQTSPLCYTLKMPVIARASSPADRQRIIELLAESLGLSEDAVALDPGFLEWKYWAPHPLFSGNRSQLIEKEERLIAHGCIWPIQLATSQGKLICYHLIDWAARRDAPGTGLRVMRRCGAGLTAQFAIGGSAITRQIQPLIGFRSYNHMWILTRPLVSPPVLREFRLVDKRKPARVLRHLLRYLTRFVSREDSPPAGWDLAILAPNEIPESLWPGISRGLAVSMRSPELLEHVSKCPVIGKSLCCALYRHSKPMAYLFLIQVGKQLRLADYGPAGLDEQTGMMVGRAALQLAKSLFPSTTEFMAATSETNVLTGLLRVGMRLRREESIQVLKTGTELEQIDCFRLTLLDWDLLCRGF
jgi:hypothetical protein